MITRLVLVAVLALAGCSGLTKTSTDAQQAGGIQGRVIGAVMPPRIGGAAEEYAALVASGAPVLGVGIENKGAAVGMLRKSSRDGLTVWRTGDNATLTERAGLVIATRGLGDDLMTLDTGGADRAIFAGQSAQVTKVYRHLDGVDKIAMTAVVCNITSRGGRDIDIGTGQKVATTLMSEDCKGTSVQFENLYWTRGGQLVQSRQWISRGTGGLALRQVAR